MGHKSRRDTLFREQNGACYWCGRLMLICVRPTSGRAPGNMCTLDHVLDRNHPRRRVAPYPGEVRRVAACYDCNQQRAVQQEREHFKALRAKDLKHPQPERRPLATLADVWPKER